MRCASCAKLSTDDFIFGGSRPLHASVPALKASAEAGCDLCALFWTACAQSQGEKGVANLLLGLSFDGEAVADASVWIEGELFPSVDRGLMKGSTKEGPNHLRVTLGTEPAKAFRSRAAQLFSETWTTVDMNPTLYLDLARKWMSNCQTKHRFCSTPFFGNVARSEMPTRLIDVGDPLAAASSPPRLVITHASKLQAPYLALSYCWGQSAQSTTWLLDSNLDDLCARIDEARLPRTHKDTFRLARELGFRYVWIDALCIIQGNAADWEHESRRMTLVYGNAALTVIAGRAADVREGFLANRLRPAAGPCAIPFRDERGMLPKGGGGGETGTGMGGELWVALPRKTEEGPVSERGWCLQEALLSPRALVFGTEQLHFRCQELHVWEGGTKARSPFSQIRNPQDARYSGTPPGSDSPAPLTRGGPEWEEEADLRRRMLIYWYKEIVPFYNERKFTNQDDVFAAISGLAQVVGAKIRSRYLAGLWEVDMIRGLLWQPLHVYSSPRPMCERRVTTITTQPQGDGSVHTQTVPVQVPSWSWAKVEGYVIMGTGNTREADYHESAWQVRPKSPGQWTRDPVCHAAVMHIPSCELELFGRPRPVKCTPYYPQDKNVNLSTAYTTKSTRRKMARVRLMPMLADEIDQAVVANCDLGDLNRVVASAWFDVAEERVDNCWCLPITKKKGLILFRNEQGKFRRVGTMDIADLAWMTSAQEAEVCLI
ncbi:heterokaryon incompatibility protein-domain-containing protein [Hypoxylon argillaceum]|nr:heterokaryon incompatibility protein-domain-containing protein [Hypoxylon argillaceum]